MALTEAKRRANDKYLAENYTILGCKVRREYADQVREEAQRRGDSVNAVIKRALDAYLEEGNSG
jgi:hypothetical protein